MTSKRKLCLLGAVSGAFIAVSLAGSGAALANPEEVGNQRTVRGLLLAPTPAGDGLPVSMLPRILPDHAAALKAKEGGFDTEGPCDKTVDTAAQLRGVTIPALVDNQTDFCTNSDIDVYLAKDGQTIVAQALGPSGAFVLIDVTDPTNPVSETPVVWMVQQQVRQRGQIIDLPPEPAQTTTPDVKAFCLDCGNGSQTDYLALALERLAGGQPSGVVIVDVTDRQNPAVVSQTLGGVVRCCFEWLDVHNVFVEKDGAGNGTFIYLAADNSADLRVLDLTGFTPLNPGLDNPDGTTASPPNPLPEIGVYERTDKNPPTDANFYDDVLVHDMYVENGTVYVSYWLGGLDIFPAADVKGTAQNKTILNEFGANVVSIVTPPFIASAPRFRSTPPVPETPFLVHHAVPIDYTGDGTADAVALQDEITFDKDAAGNAIDHTTAYIEPVQIWGPPDATAMRLDGVLLGAADVDDIAALPAHNLESVPAVEDDGNSPGPEVPARLYVGWYQAGLRAWDINDDGTIDRGVFTNPTATIFHQAQTEATTSDDIAYSGAWAVRLFQSGDLTYVVQSDRHFGLIVNCLVGSGGGTPCPATPAF